MSSCLKKKTKLNPSGTISGALEHSDLRPAAEEAGREDARCHFEMDSGTRLDRFKTKFDSRHMPQRNVPDTLVVALKSSED